MLKVDLLLKYLTEYLTMYYLFESLPGDSIWNPFHRLDDNELDKREAFKWKQCGVIS